MVREKNERPFLSHCLTTEREDSMPHAQQIMAISVPPRRTVQSREQTPFVRIQDDTGIFSSRGIPARWNGRLCSSSAAAGSLSYLIRYSSPNRQWLNVTSRQSTGDHPLRIGQSSQR